MLYVCACVCVCEILQACVSCVQDIATRVIAEGLRPEQTMVSKVMNCVSVRCRVVLEMCCSEHVINVKVWNVIKSLGQVMLCNE